MPLAVWAYFLNPKIFTDLPRWPGMLPVVPTMLISNGLLLYFFHRNTREYIGSVRCQLTDSVRQRTRACAPTLSLAECAAHAMRTPVRVCPQVRWLHGVWLVWRKPRDLAARSKAS